MKPHKHAEVIKAWADGAEIQSKVSNSDWVDCSVPHWYEGSEYRIKLRPDYVEEITVFKNMAVGLINYINKDTHWLKNPNHYSPIGNMRITFDGETGQLKSAEVI